MRFSRVSVHYLSMVGLALVSACGSDAPATGGLVEGTCEITGADTPDFLRHINCTKDFLALGSEPLDTSIPGARSVKLLIDTLDGDALYFQNSRKFKIHHEFASTHLSGSGKPLVPGLMKFNETEYFSSSRRFILGAISYYDGPKAWTFEVAPYDTADDKMIARAYDIIAKAVFFGPQLYFHPTSSSVERLLPLLPMRVKTKTSKELYAKIDYQPLNLATAIGTLRIMTAAQLTTDYVGYRDILVLDSVPNDISVVSGLITEEFQTPLSHVNVLSENRRTPNMGLRGATTNPMLKALVGKWVRLEVLASTWSIREATREEADAFWEQHKPKPVTLQPADLTARDLRDIADVVPEGTMPLRDALKTAIPAWGGKASHYSILAKTDGVPTPRAFAIPAYYYVQFMTDTGLFAQLDKLLADPDFRDKPDVRDNKLKALRAAIQVAPMDEAFQQRLRTKLAEYPAGTMRFRTSTNSEDLDGFPCAGCYESHTGDTTRWDTVLTAIRRAYASIFLFRTFEERTYNGIDHKTVVMALLVHHNFPMEEANGVALTANPYDPSGLTPGQYVNVQTGGDAEVVHPPPGVQSDQFVYQYALPGQPTVYISHSSLLPDGQTVLTKGQIARLGTALEAIHKRFSPAYGPLGGNTGWYAMDVEFKFDGDPGQEPALYVKQARPHPGRGQ